MELGLAIILVAIAFMVWSLAKVSKEADNIKDNLQNEDNKEVEDYGKE